MVQALEELVAEVVAPPAEGNNGQIIRLNQPNGVNDVVPAGSYVNYHGIPEWYLPHTAIWRWIFGESAKHPNPKALTQAQVNQQVAQSLGNLLSTIATVAGAASNAAQDLQHQISVDIPDLISLMNSDVQGLAQQIAAVRAGIGSASASAVAAAVAKADADTQALVSRVADSLGAQINQLNGSVHHLGQELVAGDRATLDAAQRYALDAAEFFAGLNAASIRSLDAREHSDVLNLNNRISSVVTQVEGDITQGDAATLGAAAGLVAGLGVPALRSQVNTLAQTVAQTAAEADQCLTPLCDTVTPNASQLGRLGGLLKTLEQLGVAGLLAGLVAAAVEDPQAAATAVEDAGGWMTDVGVSLASAVGG